MAKRKKNTSGQSKAGKRKRKNTGSWPETPESFAVDYILAAKFEGGHWAYKIRWEGYGPQYDEWVIYDIKEKTMRCEFAIAVFWLNAGTQNIYWIFDEGEEVLLNPKWSEAREMSAENIENEDQQEDDMIEEQDIEQGIYMQDITVQDVLWHQLAHPNTSLTAAASTSTSVAGPGATNPDPPLCNDHEDWLHAGLLWLPPTLLNIDGNQRGELYDILCKSLDLSGVDGKAFCHDLQRVKKEAGSDWIERHDCPICMEDGVECVAIMAHGCRDAFCAECVKRQLRARMDGQVKVPCLICRTPTFIIAKEWLFTYDANRQQDKEAARIKRRRKEHKQKQKDKKGKKVMGPNEDQGPGEEGEL